VRARLIAVVAVGLLFVGSSAAYGAWSRGAVVAAGSPVLSGSFDLSAPWTQPLSLTGMYPAQKRTGVVQLSRTGNGRWVYTVGAPTVVGGTAKVFLGTGCTGAALVLPFSQTTVQAGAATVDLCVEVTASATLAPGQTVSLTLPVTAENRSTN